MLSGCALSWRVAAVQGWKPGRAKLNCPGKVARWPAPCWAGTVPVGSGTAPTPGPAGSTHRGLSQCPESPSSTEGRCGGAGLWLCWRQTEKEGCVALWIISCQERPAGRGRSPAVRGSAVSHSLGAGTPWDTSIFPCCLQAHSQSLWCKIFPCQGRAVPHRAQRAPALSTGNGQDPQYPKGLLAFSGRTSPLLQGVVVHFFLLCARITGWRLSPASPLLGTSRWRRAENALRHLGEKGSKHC